MFFYFRKLDLVVVDYCNNEFYDNLIFWGFYVDWSFIYFGNFVFGVVMYCLMMWVSDMVCMLFFDKVW